MILLLKIVYGIQTECNKNKTYFCVIFGSLDELGRFMGFMNGNTVIKTRLNVKIMDDKMVREKNN